MDSLEDFVATNTPRAYDHKGEVFMKRQAVNPILPLSEYIPDGEPHVFGERVYLFGSHDKEAGETFCMLDYMG